MSGQILAPGSLVRLASGGPLMTFESMKGTKVTVVWREEGATCRETFEAATLVPAADQLQERIIRYQRGIETALILLTHAMRKYTWDETPTSDELSNICAVFRGIK